MSKAPKPKNQGSAGTPHTQKPMTSAKPATGNVEPAKTAQNKRGYHIPGTHGSRKS